jgi:uncharacterized membrane protein
VGKGRLEAFSDGVIAILITIMVLELHPPQTGELSALAKSVPGLLNYLLSFIYVGIYWNNHHHLLHTADKVNGVILWANLHLLFWLSLVPFATGYASRTHFAPLPTALYGLIFLLAAVAYTILQRAIISFHGTSSRLSIAVGADIKGKLSMALYIAGIVTSFFEPYLGFTLYIAVAVIWLVPDRRIEQLENYTGQA